MDYVRKILSSIKKDFTFDLVKVRHLLAAKFGLEEILIIQGEMPMTLWDGSEVYLVSCCNFQGFSKAVHDVSNVLTSRNIVYADVCMN